MQPYIKQGQKFSCFTLDDYNKNLLEKDREPEFAALCIRFTRIICIKIKPKVFFPDI